jgi:hypothetical protein
VTTITIVRPAPAVTRSGLPWKPYVYRGNGPFLNNPEDREEDAADVVAADGKCLNCGYKRGAPNCRALCRSKR